MGFSHGPRCNPRRGGNHVVRQQRTGPHLTMLTAIRNCQSTATLIKRSRSAAATAPRSNPNGANHGPVQKGKVNDQGSDRTRHLRNPHAGLVEGGGVCAPLPSSECPNWQKSHNLLIDSDTQHQDAASRELLGAGHRGR